MKKMERYKKTPLFIIAILVMGITPIILFCTSVKDRIPSENKTFILILFEAVFFFLFLSLIYSGKKQQQFDKKTETPKLIYLKMIKYGAMFLITAILAYVLFGYNNKVAVIGVLLPMVLLWFYRAFKRK